MQTIQKESILRNIILSCLSKKIIYLQIGKNKIFPNEDQEIILRNEMSRGHFVVSANEKTLIVFSIRNTEYFIDDFIVYYKNEVVKRIEFENIKITFEDDK